MMQEKVELNDMLHKTGSQEARVTPADTDTGYCRDPGNIMKYGKTAVLYFDMTDPDIVEDFQDVLAATKMSVAIWELGAKLRDLDKYGFEGDKEDLLEALRKHYYEVLEDHGIERVGY